MNIKTKRGLIFIIITTVLIIYLIFNNTNENIAKRYVKDKGYKIISEKGEVQKYIFDKSLLESKSENILYHQVWSVQNNEPSKYFGKEILVYGFEVKNHPLEKKDSNAKDGVDLYIMLTDNKVIGGFSLPNVFTFGSCYPLDGRTLEEITGLTYSEWTKIWNEKKFK